MSGYQNKRIIEVNLNQDATSEERSGVADSAILITFITVLGYYWAYSYKRGYFAYYGVPENIISQVDVISIIVACSVLFTIVVGPYSFYLETNTLFHRVSNPIAVIFKNKIIPLIIVWLLLVFITSSFIWIWSSVILAWGIWIYLSPLLKYRRIDGYKNKLKEVIVRDTTNEFVKRLLEILKSKSLAKYTFIILLSFLLGSIISLIGFEQAKRQKEYIQIEFNDTTYLVIDVAGENYLITPYDRTTNSIKSRFSIIDIKTDFEDRVEFESVRLKDYLKVKK